MQDIGDFMLAMLGGRSVEITAALLGFVNVLLVVRRSVWNYPFGIAMVTLYAWVFFDARLYSDALLQVFFFVIQFYGWVHWRRNLAGDDLVRVARLGGRLLAACAGAALAGTAVWGWLMHRFTDAAYPFWDGSVAVTSVIAQLLLSRRYLENWYFWIAVDLSAIALFTVKGLYPTAVLYVVFLFLSLWGWWSWRRAERSAAQ